MLRVSRQLLIQFRVLRRLGTKRKRASAPVCCSDQHHRTSALGWARSCPWAHGLAKWVRDGGGAVHPAVTLQWLPHCGHALVATEGPVDAGTVILSVPLRLAITVPRHCCGCRMEPAGSRNDGVPIGELARQLLAALYSRETFSGVHYPYAAFLYNGSQRYKDVHDFAVDTSTPEANGRINLVAPEKAMSVSCGIAGGASDDGGADEGVELPPSHPFAFEGQLSVLASAPRPGQAWLERSSGCAVHNAPYMTPCELRGLRNRRTCVELGNTLRQLEQSSAHYAIGACPWALSVALSRTRVGPQGSLVMAPLVDLCNHSFRPTGCLVASRGWEDSVAFAASAASHAEEGDSPPVVNGSLNVVALRDIKQGEEVTLMYSTICPAGKTISPARGNGQREASSQPFASTVLPPESYIGEAGRVLPGNTVGREFWLFKYGFVPQGSPTAAPLAHIAELEQEISRQLKAEVVGPLAHPR